MEKRIIIVALSAIMLLAVAVRIGLQRDDLFFPDSCVYLAMAENIKHGDFSHSLFVGTSLHQPLYSLATAVISLAGPSVERAGLIVSLVSGLGLVLILFLLGRRLAGPGTGLAAALLAAGDPVLAAYSSELLTESLFLCLFTLVTLLTLRAGDGRRLLLTAGCGVLAAAAFTARFIGLAALPMALLWVALLRFIHPPAAASVRFRRAVAAGLLVLLGCALAASPILVRNRVVRGEWSLTGFAGKAPPVAAEAVYGDPGEAEVDGRGLLGALEERLQGLRADNAMDLALAEYVAVFWRVFVKMVPAAWLVLALAGLVLLPVRRGISGLFPWCYLLSWLLLPMAVTIVARTASGEDEVSRYLVPVLPSLLLLTAVGLSAAADLVAGLAGRRPGRWRTAGPLLRLILPLAIVLVLVPVINVGRLLDLRAERSGRVGQTTWVDSARDTAEVIRRWADAAGIEKPVVKDRKPFAAYYSGSFWRVLQDDWPPILSHRCRRGGVDLVVVDSAAVALHLPRLATLVPGEQIPPGLRLVHYRVFPEQKRVLALYEVVPWDLEERDGLADIGSGTADQHALAGRRLYDGGEMHRAGLHFRRAVELRPGFAEAWYQLGSVYFHKSLYLVPRQRHFGVFDEAIRCYREAARFAPRLAAMARKEVSTLERNMPRDQLSMVYTRLGERYADEGRLREARNAFHRASVLDPHNQLARDRMHGLDRQGAMEVPR